MQRPYRGRSARPRGSWTLIAAGVLVAAFVTTLVTPLRAHGGMYRGPGDPRFPQPGTGSPGPTTPGSSSPRSPTTIGSGASWTDWQLWWELHKDPFLRLRERVWSGDPISGTADFELGRGLREERERRAPTEKERLEHVLPALAGILKEKRDGRDLFTSVLIALGKADGGSGKSLPHLMPWLEERDQELRESAVLALGLSTATDAVETLVALARGDEHGRRLLGRHEVDYRTQAFACYGLGLIAEATRHPGILVRISEVLRELLAEPLAKQRNDYFVAVLHAIRLFPRDPGSEILESERRALVEAVSGFVARRGVDSVVEAHAWPCLARLIGPGSDERESLQKQLLPRLTSKTSAWITQSAILALGDVTMPEDVRVVRTLQHYALEGNDRLARRFAFVTLGRIGGADVHEFLMRELARPSTQQTVLPWIGFGLALELRGRDPSVAPDTKARELLFRVFRETSNPANASGLGLALALVGAKEAGPELLRRLEDWRAQEEPAGHLAVAVGLLGHQAGSPLLEELIRDSLRRPRLLGQSAIGLALLEGDGLTPLLAILERDDRYPLAVYAGLAEAIGFVGEQRSVEPLLRLALDREKQPLARAFVVAALGRVLSPRPLPWNSPIGIQTNYAAQIETLSNGSTGILDIL